MSEKLGAFFWIGTMQFFIVTHIIERFTNVPYSVQNQVLSDLGITRCVTLASGRFFCSPQAWLFATTLCLQGTCMITGALLVGRRIASRTAVTLIALAGMTLFGIAAFPENTATAVHIGFAAAHCCAANFALLAFGITRPKSVGLISNIQVVPREELFRAVSIALGLVGAAASIALIVPHWFAGSTGYVERFAVYPFPTMLIVLGLRELLGTRRKA